METIFFFAKLVFFIQLIHSIEELATGFHKKWYLVKISFRTFLIFEIVHNLFWMSVLFYDAFPYRSTLTAFFIPLMFANGIQHIVWAGSVKRYVPGLVTAIIHVIAFFIFYFRFFSQVSE